MPTIILRVLALVVALPLIALAQPDLSANNVLGPASVTAGQTFQITRDISNIGTVAVGSFSYDIRLSPNTTISTSDALVATVNSTNLGIVAANVTLPANFPAGIYYIGLVVNPAPGETNTSNNVAVSFATMTVFTGPADLQAVSVVGPASASPGQTVAVTRNIANSGGALVNGPLTYQIRLSDDQTIDFNDTLLLQIGSNTLGGLAVNVTIPAGQQLGTYWLGLVVAAYPGETNVANNIVAATMPTVIVSSAPTISAVTPNSGSVLGGETVTISGTNFDLASTVDFGATPAQAVTFVNPTTLDAVVPPSPNQSIGTVDVTVTTANGSVTATAAYTYGQPYPGSGEDLQLLVGVNGPPDSQPVKTAVPGDTITMNLSSPMGAFDGLGAVLIAQLYPTGGTPPFSITGYPEVWIDPIGAIIVLDGNRPTPFGPIVYAPGGITVPFLYPGGLAGYTGRAQAFCVTNTALNGLFATSDALEVQY